MSSRQERRQLNKEKQRQNKRSVVAKTQDVAQQKHRISRIKIRHYRRSPSKRDDVLRLKRTQFEHTL